MTLSKKLITKDLEESVAIQENKILRQLLEQKDTQIYNLQLQIKVLKEKLLKLRHFEDLRKNYLNTIERQNEAISVLEKQLKEMKQKAEQFDEFLKKLQELADGHTEVVLFTDFAILRREDYERLRRDSK